METGFGKIMRKRQEGDTVERKQEENEVEKLSKSAQLMVWWPRHQTQKPHVPSLACVQIPLETSSRSASFKSL